MNGGPAEAEDNRRRNAARLAPGKCRVCTDFDFINGPSFRFVLRNMDPRVVTIRHGVIAA
jgi:hypothetical protein